MEIDLIEKAAFACFSQKVEDSFKRLLFIKIAKIVQENPKISTNRCFAELSSTFRVERVVFDCAVSALETPFKFLRINRYHRPAEKGVREIQHLSLGEGEPWQRWLDAVLKQYPELLVWINE